MNLTKQLNYRTHMFNESIGNDDTNVQIQNGADNLKYTNELKHIIQTKQKYYDPRKLEQVLNFLGMTQDEIPSGSGSIYKRALKIASKKERDLINKKQFKFNPQYGNSHLHGAKIRKDDQYLIPYPQAVKIANAYKQFLSGKNILCNCDDPRYSNTFKALKDNFSTLGINSVTAIGMPPGYSSGEQAYMERFDKNGSSGLIAVSNGGDFRTGESEELLKKCDVVMSNPPFSKKEGEKQNLFIQYILKLMQFRKDFITIGPTIGASYKDLRDFVINEDIFVVKSAFQIFDRPEKTDQQRKLDKLTNKKHDKPADVSLWSTFRNDPFGTEIKFNDEIDFSTLPLTTPTPDGNLQYPISMVDDVFSINFIPSKPIKNDDIPPACQNKIVVPISIFDKRMYDKFEVCEFTDKVVDSKGKKKFEGVILQYKNVVNEQKEKYMNKKYTKKQLKEAIEYWSNMLQQINEAAYTDDFNYFEGKSEFKTDFQKILDKSNIVENTNKKLYAISGSLIYWLASCLTKLFLEEKPIRKAELLGDIREFFERKDFWEEVEETPAHKERREIADGASSYYSSKGGHDNFTGD